MSSLLTEDTGRSSQLFSASRARADSAPDKSISALVAQDSCEVNMTSIDLQEMITQRKDVVYMTFVLDTGCSTTLSSTTIHPVLQDSTTSTIKIRGFKGQQREPGMKHGYAYMYALSTDPKQPGTPVMFSVDTVKSINHNLYSITEAFEQQGFDVHLQHRGFSGLIKTDARGNESRIPAHYDWDNHQWLLHVAVAANYDTARKAGIDAERQIASHIDCNSIETAYLTLPEQISEIVDRGGVITMRDNDHITSIDIDAMIALVDALDSTIDTTSTTEIEAATEAISKLDTTAGCSKNAHARGRAMNDYQWHVHTGHAGYHKDCDICRQIRASLRRAYPVVDPHQEERAGYTWAGDTITWSSRSRHGCKYTTVFRDRKSKVFKLIHSVYRSDLTSQIEALVMELRNNPLYNEGKKYKIMTILELDVAGEWRDDNKEWNEMCKRVGIIIRYGSPDDKRSFRENSVKQIEMGTKAIMAERSLPVDWWQEAANQAAELRNLLPTSENIVSSDGDAIRPEEELSDGRISRKECDRRLHYHVLVGTPAMVSDINQPKGSNIDQLNRVRWGIALKMINGDLPMFMDPHTGSTFRSRSYRLFQLKPGESAWHFCGAEVPRLAQTAHRRPCDDQEPQERVIDLESFALVRKEDGDGPRQSYLQAQIVDRDQQCYEPGSDGYLKSVSIEKLPLRDRKMQDHESEIGDSINITKEIDMLKANPHHFISRDCWKRFPHPHGVHHGVVSKVVSSEEPRWDILYNDGDSEHYTVEDMINYCIKRIDGTTNGANQDATSEGGVDLIKDHPVYHTKNRDTFESICKAINVPQGQRRLYYEWLGEQFGMGHKHKTTQGGLHFVNPYGGGKATKFDADVRFPLPQGDSWQRKVRDHVETSNECNTAHIDAYIAEANMLMHINMERIKDMMRNDHDNAIASLAEQIAPAPDPRVDPKYVDEKTGRLIAPKTLNEAKRRSDWKHWEAAMIDERKSFKELGVLSTPQTLKVFKSQGYTKPPVPLIAIWTAPYTPENKLKKFKCRICAQGHSGNVTKGVHFFNTFAAAPNCATTRLMHAISTTLKLIVINYDIKTAYLWGDMEEDEKVPVSLPKGMQEYDEKTGEPLYYLLEKPVYGMPFSSRRWSRTRDAWILEEFNCNGFTCTQSRNDPCLFTIKQGPDRAWLIIHTDDIQSFCSSAEFGAMIANKFDERFKIAMVDANQMLGVLRTHHHDDETGVTTVRLTQPGFIEDLYNQYAGHLPKRVPSTPFPEKEFLSLADDKGNRIEPPEDEMREVFSLGYQSIVGALLWSARQCYPDIALGVNMLQRVMSKPTMRAWKAAMHTLSYLHSVRHRGITFSSNGNKDLRVFYDSSNRGDYADEKAQYGFACMLFNGPVRWASRKQRHVGTSSTHNEYMALFHACVDTVWLRNLLKEAGLDEHVKDATIALGDNDQATRLSHEDIVTSGNRMIRNNYHFVKECVEEGDIDTRRVDTLENIADPMTKALSRQYCERLLPVLTGNGDGLPELPQPAKL